MKVKEYLVNRILELERELKQARNEKAGTVFGLQKLQEDVIKLNEKIEQYQIEREHIKEIISCNIGRDAFNHLEISLKMGENDFKTLLAMLDINPADCTIKSEDDDIPPCWGCKHEDLEGCLDPCAHCFEGDKREVATDAETKD